MIDRHLSTNLTSSVKRREPAIRQLATAYNKLCDQMDTEIHRERAPEGAICPLRIERTELFNISVDDDIWQDVGLRDLDDEEGTSLWLSNDHIRQGIRVRLELDRCGEEEARVRHERCALQDWLREEWTSITQTQIQEGIGLFFIGLALH